MTQRNHSKAELLPVIIKRVLVNHAFIWVCALISHYCLPIDWDKMWWGLPLAITTIFFGFILLLWAIVAIVNYVEACE